MKKRVFYTEISYLLGLVIMAFGAAFTELSDLIFFLITFKSSKIEIQPLVSPLDLSIFLVGSCKLITLVAVFPK